jgi:hypothetical protein
VKSAAAANPDLSTSSDALEQCWKNITNRFRKTASAGINLP